MNYEKIKLARENLELTQQEIANKLDISRSTYAGWENNIDNIPLLKFIKLCNILNVSMDYIIDFTDIKERKYSIDNEFNINILCDNLKFIREKSNDSQKRVSQIIGVDISSYSRYERGQRTILTLPLIEFVRHYNISLDKLCFEKLK